MARTRSLSALTFVGLTSGFITLAGLTSGTPSSQTQSRASNVSTGTGTGAITEPSVLCAVRDRVPVHKKYQGRDDVEAELTAGQAVRILEARVRWRKVTYTAAKKRALGWIERSELGICVPASRPQEPSRVSEPIPKTPPRNNCLFGCPVGAPAQNTVLGRPIYSLSSNPITKFADWVAYRVSTRNFGPRRHRNWQADPDLPAAETLERADYNTAALVLGVDRGHQAPLATFDGSPFWRAANYLSNVTPQQADLNQGAWQRLEEAERALAPTSNVWVVTGPLYERPMPMLPKADEAHTVPSGYWKVVATFDHGRTETLAVVFDQATPKRAGFCGREVAIDEVERRSRLDIFPLLPLANQRELEAGSGTLTRRLGCAAQEFKRTTR